MNYEACTTLLADPILTVKEKKSSFQLNNPQRLQIRKIQVDGCLIRGERERCDWLPVIEQDVVRALYIELKGSKIDKAVKQLEATLQDTRQEFITARRECFVVSTRVPKYGPSVHKRVQAFFRKNGATLKVEKVRAIVAA